MVLFALLMITFDEKAYPVIVGVYATALEFMGIRLIWYYFTMARHMVGGRSILYRGVLFVDFGVFTGSLALVPHIYVLLYLAGTLAFSAVVDLLRAKEAKGIDSPWKLKTFFWIDLFGNNAYCKCLPAHAGSNDQLKSIC